MSKTRWIPLGALAAVMLLSACAEKTQTAGTRKVDTAPWAGAQTAYAAPGWQAGNQASWEEQMKIRSQGQNEYPRAPARP
jgi:hypothetical protein